MTRSIFPSAEDQTIESASRNAIVVTMTWSTGNSSLRSFSWQAQSSGSGRRSLRTSSTAATRSWASFSRTAEQAKEVIVEVGDTEESIERAEKLYRINRKLATQTEAKRN